MDLPLRMVPEDRYEFRAEVARGGMGVIYQAQDNEIGRDVAIKVLLDEYERSPEMLARFVAEAQIAGQLQHPGVAPVHEIGELPNGRPFFAMELVTGETFSSILKSEEREKAGSRLIEIFEKICQTMGYAHARGVIHRDLKPSNVIVGTFGQVQILDWGLATVFSAEKELHTEPALQTVRSTCSDGSHSGSTTRLGSGMGTLGYASPEQALGDFTNVDRKSDVYSLGAILCEILTGQPAVPKSNESKDLAVAASHDTDEPFSRLDRCQADSFFIELAKACLSPDPKSRPADAGVLAQQVADHQQSVRQRLQQAELAAGRAEAKSVEERKRRVVSIGLATTAVLLCAISLAAWILVSNEQRRRDIAEQGRQSLVIQSINDALTDAVRLRELARASPITRVQPWMRALEAAERADAMAAEHGVAQELALKVTQTLTSLKAEAKNRKFFADIEAARTQADEVLLHHYNTKQRAERFTEAFGAYGIEPVVMEPQDAAKIVRNQEAEFLDELVTIANQWWLLDPRGRKTKQTGKWVRRFVDQLDPDPWRRDWRDKIGRTKNNRDDILPLLSDPATLQRPVGDLVNLAQGLSRTRTPWIPEIIDFLQKAEKRHPRSVWIKFWLADYCARMDSPERTQAGLRCSELLLLLRPTPIGRVLHAKLLRRSGNLDEAEAELRDLLQSHPQNAAALVEMVGIESAKSQWQQALEFHEAANAAHRDLTYSRDLKGRAEIHVSTRAHIYVQLGRCQEAIEIYQRLVEEMPRMAFQHYRNLGEVYLAAGRPEDAIAALQKVEPKNGKAWQSLARAYLATQNHELTIAALRSSIELQPAIPTTHYLLAEALAASGDCVGSAEAYRNGFSRDTEPKISVGRLTSAARVAVLAVSDPSKEDLTELERDQLRYLARTWLRVAIDRASEGGHSFEALDGVLDDSSFDDLRNPSAHVALPAGERDAWSRLWQDVRDLKGR